MEKMEVNEYKATQYFTIDEYVKYIGLTYITIRNSLSKCYTQEQLESYRIRQKKYKGDIVRYLNKYPEYILEYSIRNKKKRK